MKYIYLYILLFSYTFVNAQLLNGNNKFSKTDTLRGALRIERTSFDVNFYDLNLDLDIDTKEIKGSNKIFFTVFTNTKKIQIDLFENMKIDSIVYENKNLEFTREFNAVFVSFSGFIFKNDRKMIEVFYHGKPIIAKNAPWDGGFTWKKDEKGNDWIAVSCEGIGASLWWPNKDHLSDEPDSMRVTCSIPKDLKYVGNGILEKNVIENGKRSMTWKVSYPINNYNVTLNIGKYTNFKDKYYSIQDSSELILDYWVMPYNLEKAKKHFQQVKPLLAANEYYFGKFPFWKDNYKLVETPYLGMEHQTAIAYGNDYKTGYNGHDFSGIGLDFDYIIIHESGHEYWGNLISAADIADLWIHEGFCTYSEALYVEYLYDYETSLRYINAKKRTVGNRKPLLGKHGLNNEGDGDMYSKGMLLLNTLRHTINNDTLWFNILKEMTTKEFAYKTVSTKDIVDFINKKTLQDYTQFFNQYLAYKDLPKLYYSVSKVKGSKYQINFKWLTDVENFYMPIIIKVGKKEYRIEASNELKTIIVKKGSKDKIEFDQEKFYFKTRKSDI